MWPDGLSNPGPLTCKTGALPTALCRPAHYQSVISEYLLPLIPCTGAVSRHFTLTKVIYKQKNWVTFKLFYCFQSATVYSCFICFQIISEISGGWADWNITKFPRENLYLDSLYTEIVILKKQRLFHHVSSLLQYTVELL